MSERGEKPSGGHSSSSESAVGHFVLQEENVDRSIPISLPEICSLGGQGPRMLRTRAAASEAGEEKSQWTARPLAGAGPGELPAGLRVAVTVGLALGMCGPTGLHHVTDASHLRALFPPRHSFILGQTRSAGQGSRPLAEPRLNPYTLESEKERVPLPPRSTLKLQASLCWPCWDHLPPRSQSASLGHMGGGHHDLVLPGPSCVEKK